MQHPEVPVLCGEYQGVIAKLRQEGYALNRVDEGPSTAGGVSGANSNLRSRNLFCLREPGLFLDIFKIMTLKELRKEVSVLTATACNVREKLRMYASMARDEDALDPSEILRPLLECIRSPSTSASVTSEALASVHRLVVTLKLFKEPSERVVRALHHVVEATVECVFRQTESGDDEIAVMWALELLEACLACPAAASLTQRELESVYVTVFKNSVLSTNADMLRRLASRKLSSMISSLFGSLYGAVPDTGSSHKDRDEKLAKRLFAFLCRRLDPHGPGWHEPELRQTSLDLVLSAIVSTIDSNSGEVLVDQHPGIHALICDELFCALLQTCQMACRPLSAAMSDRDAQDLVPVLPASSATSLAGKSAASSISDDSDSDGSDSEENEDEISDHDEEHDNDNESANNADSRRKSEAKSSSKSEKAPATNSTQSRDSQNLKLSLSSLSSSSRKASARADSPFARIPSTFRELEAQYNAEAFELLSPSVSGAGAPRVPLGLLSRALRLVHILVSHSNTRRHLRVQMEVFCGSVFLRALEAKPKTTDNEARRLVLETLTDLFADQTIAVDIFCNFDCDLNSSNVLEHLFVFLSNHSFPKQLRKLALDPLQLMSLRCIHLGVKSIAARSGEAVLDPAKLHLEKMYDPKALIEAKRSKRRLHKCVLAFNRKPKNGVAALVDAGFVSDPPTSAELADFLRNTQGLDKSMIGEFIGDYHEKNVEVLHEFVKTFEMDGMSLLSALRMFLESFRLPGEAQVIDRILQSFAERAHAECGDARNFPTVDCCYLLCFSIILLNTDLHNPNIRPEKKMSFDAFTLSNRNYGESVSKGQDMPLSLLRSIYDEIRAREINTMTDGSSLTAEVTSDRWADLMTRRKASMKLVTSGCVSNSASLASLCRLYDEQMFAFIHKPAFAALSVVYHAGDPVRQPRAVELALEGIINCAEVAARFGMVRVLDRVVVDICKFTTLLLYAQASNSRTGRAAAGHKIGRTGSVKKVLPTIDSVETDLEDDDDDASAETQSRSQEGQTEGVQEDVIEEDDAAADSDEDSQEVAATRARNAARDVLGSPNSIAGAMRALERSSKAQTATSSVLKIVLQHADRIRLAWPYIVYCLMRLFDLELLPADLLQESSDPLLEGNLRAKYHRISASGWLRNAESKAATARAALERSKGWVSWFNGESRADAEANLHSREEELYTVKRAVSFASQSLSRSSHADKLLVHQTEPKSPAVSSSSSPTSQQQQQQAVTSQTHGSGADTTESAQARQSRVRIETTKLGGLVSRSKELPDLTLVAFVRGIIVACGGSETHLLPEDDLLVDSPVNFADEDEVSDLRGDIRVDMLAPPSRASRLFSLHLLMEVAVANENRLQLIWPMVRMHLIKTLRSADHASCHTEKASIALLRLSVRRIWHGGDDVSGALRFLLRLPSAVAPDFPIVVCDTLVRAFDKPPADKPIWNDAISRTLILISQTEDFRACLRGLQILNKISTHARLVEVNMQDLLNVHRSFVGRSLAHKRWVVVNGQGGSQAGVSSSEAASGAVSPDGNASHKEEMDSTELLTDLLNLLFILHSRLLESMKHDAKWFTSEQAILESFHALMETAELPDTSSQVSKHAFELLRNSVNELIEGQCLNADQWVTLYTKAMSTKSCGKDTAPLLISLQLDVLHRMERVMQNLSSAEFEELCIRIATDVMACGLPKQQEQLVSILERWPGKLKVVRESVALPLMQHEEPPAPVPVPAPAPVSAQTQASASNSVPTPASEASEHGAVESSNEPESAVESAQVDEPDLDGNNNQIGSPEAKGVESAS